MIQQAVRRVIRRLGSGKTKASKDAPSLSNSLSPDAPATTLPQGTRARISHGSAFHDTRGLDGSSGGHTRNVAGTEVVVDGQPYVAKGGPNKGKEIQTVKDPVTGRLYGVPADRLRRSQGEGRSNRVGWSRSYEENYERVFGKKNRRA